MGRRRAAPERLRLRGLLRDPHRPGRSLPADGKEDHDRLRLRDAVRGRQDQTHAEDLARRTGDEGARLDLTLSVGRAGQSERSWPSALARYSMSVSGCAPAKVSASSPAPERL